MSTVLHLVYHYRRLAAKCASPAGLEIDEIDTLATIEALFARQDGSGDTDLWSCRREFSREQVAHAATMRSTKHSDPVTIVNLGPGGAVCQSGPYVELGDVCELIVTDEELSLSYRFKAAVQWRRDQLDGDYTIGFRLLGVPLMVHHGEPADDVNDDRARTERDQDIAVAA